MTNYNIWRGRLISRDKDGNWIPEDGLSFPDQIYINEDGTWSSTQSEKHQSLYIAFDEHDGKVYKLSFQLQDAKEALSECRLKFEWLNNEHSLWEQIKRATRLIKECLFSVIYKTYLKYDMIYFNITNAILRKIGKMVDEVEK